MNNNRIFLCHASEDKDKVIDIYKLLKYAGFNPWLDKMDLLPGVEWDKEIRRALRSAKFIIIFFSKKSTTKRGYIQREFKLVLDTYQEIPEGEIFAIPVRLNDCLIPENFRHLQYIDLFEENNFSKVIELLRKELSLFYDSRDGKTYKTIKIGDKIWMAENLNYEVKNSWCYDDDPQNGFKYGRLYTWEAALEACPAGWHIPTDKEWRELIAYFGGASDDLGLFNLNPKNTNTLEKLIEGGDSGFNIKMGGLYDLDAKMFKGSYEKHMNGYYWGKEFEKWNLYCFSAKHRTIAIMAEKDNTKNGYSCRYVK